MNADAPTAPDRRRPWRVLGWTLLVALLAAGGWSGWRAYDYRAAGREAREAGLFVVESPTPFAAILTDWRVAIRPATWTQRKRRLELRGGTDLVPLLPLLRRLEPTDLTVWQCRHLDALGRLARLQRLDLSYSKVKDLAPLAGLTQLQVLRLDGCSGVADLTPLAGLTQLQVLSLAGCTRVADLAPLASPAGLRVLVLIDCTGLSAEAVAAFKKSHPQVQIAGPDGQPVNAE